MVAADCIDASSLIKKVYNSDVVTEFLAKVMQKPKLYQYADEFQSINIGYLVNGGNRAWHYDGSDCVVTVLLQPADIGGEFEFAPFVRGNRDSNDNDNFIENYEVIQSVVDGKYPTIVKRAEAGTLNLFNGRRSLHRVRTVYGGSKRIVAVLSYDTEVGKCGTPMKNVTLYGDRVRNIYKDRGIVL